MNTPSENQKPKKLLENNFVSSLIVPIAIVLVGAVIIFGVTKMLSTERSYRDLVREMQSKTFGNRWVAAYELSKQINAGAIPENDHLWLIENLNSVYNSSNDPRTRNFIVVALGSMKNEKAMATVEKALSDKDSNVVFAAIVALGNSKGISFDWSKLVPFLDSDDKGLVQASMVVLASQKFADAEEKIKSYMVNPDSGRSLRYAAATSLLNYNNESSLELVEEILTLKAVEKGSMKPGDYDMNQVLGLKHNVITVLGRTNWAPLKSLVKKYSLEDKDVKVVAKAREVLNQLKN